MFHLSVFDQKRRVAPARMRNHQLRTRAAPPSLSCGLDRIATLCDAGCALCDFLFEKSRLSLTNLTCSHRAFVPIVSLFGEENSSVRLAWFDRDGVLHWTPSFAALGITMYEADFFGMAYFQKFAASQQANAMTRDVPSLSTVEFLTSLAYTAVRVRCNMKRFSGSVITLLLRCLQESFGHDALRTCAGGM